LPGRIHYATIWLHNKVDTVFKALADPSRRALLDQLHAQNGQTLNQLCRHLDMTRQGITKHLGVLIKAELVVPLWRGREKLHYLNPAPLKQIAERWIDKHKSACHRALSDLTAGLNALGAMDE
jgi:DNA-binding transcriptional ArsR family regulator